MALHRKHHGPSLPPSPSSHSPSAHNSNQHVLAPSTDELRATLSTILPLLDAFNHRHRNQHRSSSWWSTFGIFRRSLANLARALDCQIPGTTTTTNRSKKRHAIDNVGTRVTWLNNHVLPRAFVAFTQLITDNQHAPLGLLLLALLARIHSQCSKWLPPPDQSPAQPPPTALTPRPPLQPTSNTDRDVPHDQAEATSPDRGITISRKTLLGPETHAPATAPTERERESKTSKPIARSTTADGSRGNGAQEKVRKKVKKKKGDTLSSIFGSLA
ncbi:hypothetical protein E4U55_002185 [Claviceps digitariae]|nr:hypothetical protein E4U55_002185 [Claviceps digitariae]